MMEILETKIFDDIVYIDENHSYWHNETRFTSVTQYLSRYKHPFDKDRWSKHSAKKEGVSQQTILEQWDERSKKSLEKGTIVHNFAEAILKGDNITLDEALPEVIAVSKFWCTLKEQYKAKMLKTEWVIGDKKTQIAGRIDAIIQFERNGKTVTSLLDWKTGTIKLKNHFQKMKAPFTHLDDCSFNHYSMQLSLYRLILERNLNIKLDHGLLVNLTNRGDIRPLVAKDFRDDLIKILYT